MSLTKTLFMAGTAAVALSAFASRPAFAIPSSTTTTSPTNSFSTAEIDTIIDTPVTQQVNVYSTTLTGQIEGGPVLYDQTFPVAFADPVFQSAIGSAESVLTGAGAVSFLGPTLTSSTTTTTSTTNTVQTGSMVTDVSFLTTEYIGPQTIDIGDFGVCQSYPPPTGCSIPSSPYTGQDLNNLVGINVLYPIPPGGVDYDTFELFLVDVFTTTTTTNTDLLTQDYNLVGVPLAAVPEPSTWTLLGAGLLGLGRIFWQRTKDRAARPSA